MSLFPSRPSQLNLELDSQFRAQSPSATRLYGKGQLINRLISRHGRVISRHISPHRRVISRLRNCHSRAISRLISRHRRVISWLISRLRRKRLISHLGRVISRLVSCFFPISNSFGECPIGDFRSHESISAWMYLILKYCSINSSRKFKAKRTAIFAPSTLALKQLVT